MSVRETQQPIETSIQPGTGKDRVTQESLEVSLQSGAGNERLTEENAEASYQSGQGTVRASQLAVEVSATIVPPGVFLPHIVTARLRRPEPTKAARRGFQNTALFVAPPVYASSPPRIMTARRAKAPAQEKRPRSFGPPARRRGQPWAWVITEGKP